MACRCFLRELPLASRSLLRSEAVFSACLRTPNLTELFHSRLPLFTAYGFVSLVQHDAPNPSGAVPGPAQCGLPFASPHTPKLQSIHLTYIEAKKQERDVFTLHLAH